jgi:hypothetical protein
MARFLPLVLLLSSAGCATSTNATLRSDLIRRASFDLRCDAPGLSLTELSEFGNGVVSSYGVRGCERQAVYVLQQSGVWVLNTNDHPEK